MNYSQKFKPIAQINQPQRKFSNKTMTMKAFLIFFILFFALNACKKEGVTPINDGEVKITEYRVLPETTDSQITTNTLGSPLQYAYLAQDANRRRNKLFVFIPGTFANPQVYLKILQTGAQQGYHTIGIAYSNQQTIESFCNNNQETCIQNVLKEYLEGGNSSPEVTITRSNSFENRIIKFIQYIDKTYPTDNWRQFLTADNQIRWELVSLAGHSQGSGHTMYISKNRNLMRAALFSGPNGYELPNGQYPTWVKTKGVTPNEKVYGFSNKLDAIGPWTKVSAVWAAIGLPGTETNVDNATTFNNSHRLFTTVDLPPAAINPEHGSTVADANTPLDSNGKPMFEKVWIYMCFP